MDWREMIEPAKTEWKRLRSQGLSINHALDRMRGRGYTLPAITMVLEDMESMMPDEVVRLLDEKEDWDQF